MSKSIAAAFTAAVAVLIAGPALADPASGLVPEQGKDASCCSDAVTFAGEAPKSLEEAGSVRLARTPFGAISSSLPEPASWGLMIVGFGGMGAILRNHRRAVARP